MTDPTEGAPTPPPPAQTPPTGPVDVGDQRTTTPPDPAVDATARAAADVARLLAGAIGLRRAVELAERSRRESDAHG